MGTNELFADETDVSGTLTVFDNTMERVVFELQSFNIEDAANDLVMETLSTYAHDAYSIYMDITWLAAEVSDNDYVAFCLEADAAGASCW